MMLCDKVDKSDLSFFISLIRNNDWIAEEKIDGDRCRMRYTDGKVRLFNRRGKDVTMVYPELWSIKLKCNSALLDGEVCVLDENGLSKFNEGIAFRTHCQHSTSIREAMQNYPVTYVMFDILELDGHDLRLKPWNIRRKFLEGVMIPDKRLGMTKPSHEIKALWDAVVGMGGEGIVLKQINAPYQENKRSQYWRKVKNIQEVDLKFTKYEINPLGVTVENDAGIRVQVAGHHQFAVRDSIDRTGQVMIAVRHLGETNIGKYRQPTYGGMR